MGMSGNIGTQQTMVDNLINFEIGRPRLRMPVRLYVQVWVGKNLFVLSLEASLFLR